MPNKYTDIKQVQNRLKQLAQTAPENKETDYMSLDFDQLKELEQKADAWLKANKFSPLFRDAHYRYSQIITALHMKYPQ